jgi:hypothetical protein
VIEDVKGSYADRNAPILGRSVSWNHSLAEVFTALKASGLKIDEFMEYPFSYYNCFSNTVKGEDGYFRIKNMENKLPMMFAIKAIK